MNQPFKHTHVKWQLLGWHVYSTVVTRNLSSVPRSSKDWKNDSPNQGIPSRTASPFDYSDSTWTEHIWQPPRTLKRSRSWINGERKSVTKDRRVTTFPPSTPWKSGFIVVRQLPWNLLTQTQWNKWMLPISFLLGRPTAHQKLSQGNALSNFLLPRSSDLKSPHCRLSVLYHVVPARDRIPRQTCKSKENEIPAYWIPGKWKCWERKEVGQTNASSWLLTFRLLPQIVHAWVWTVQQRLWELNQWPQPPLGSAWPWDSTLAGGIPKAL